MVTVWKLTRKFSEINPDMKKLRKARSGRERARVGRLGPCSAAATAAAASCLRRVVTITAVAQLFVLGCTWGFGLFLFSPESWHNTVLAYVFTVLNCLQGTFLYVLHCLLNKKVWQAGKGGWGDSGLGGSRAPSHPDRPAPGA